MTAKELKTAAVATLTALKQICKKANCKYCGLHTVCGVRAPEGLTDQEINDIADRIAVQAGTEAEHGSN
jgi:biotin synthase-like enzyme